MKVSYGEGVASHTALESCVTMPREVRHEALTEVQAGQPLSRENILTSGRRRCKRCWKAIRGGRDNASVHPVLRGRRPWHACTLLVQELGDLWVDRHGSRSASGTPRRLRR